ncbi:ABC transporter ATP-binding protein [Peribacillus sp. NPDC096448]|uniref:ABC transporter ATP-binding protein n=1 Tax=Peribacillus sp. NPDC096448 TaxID=3364395 RepID=UPI0037F90BD4
MLTLNNIVKQYENGDGINNISFSVKSGEIVGLLGANGAGKTTTLRCICGLYSVEEGEVNLFGSSPNTNQSRKLTVFIPDSPYLYPTLTVAEHLQFKAKAFGVPKSELRAKVQEALKEVNLESYADRPSGNLSRGQKQRILLAAAYLQEASLYLLDEPTVGLDIPSKQWLAQWLKKNAENQKSVIISSHSLDFVMETANRVILIQQGKIVNLHTVPTQETLLEPWRKAIIRELGGHIEDE